ncbi:hypothetical protein H7E67_03905 [Clostridium gasigenes]|uniref:HK97-gp10 family putative phage morphogenesis protein n=1 Tax=Clostridium gasigenes TaxID=94869 RepID=UPI00162556D6|nr:HK97-gp10 family putative phage morphogenesis protein [Clostridium gasigenes]MBB6622567.1 hypothetical protein [Clostridium gasigenes]
MISFDYGELKILQKQLEQVATERETAEADKKALNRIGDFALAELKATILVSKDVTKSRYYYKGTVIQTFIHTRDALKKKVYSSKWASIVVVDYDTNHRYYNFLEFGSSQQAPTGTFKKVFIRQVKQYSEIITEEYEKLVEKVLKY